MDLKKTKSIIIIEGADACGKSQLCNFLRDYVDGKCHTMHSNFNKSLPKSNHFKQHKLMIKFVTKQFNKHYYTGNSLVILDRNYISDIVYGKSGYGSKGTYEQKIKKLAKMFNKLQKSAKVFVIYCNTQANFDLSKERRDELLSSKENLKVKHDYDDFFKNFYEYFNKKVRLYNYNYLIDPNYEKLKDYFENIIK